MCDKIIDCLNGEDEINCNSMRTTHTFGDIFLTAPPKLIDNFMRQSHETEENESEQESTEKQSFETTSTTDAPANAKTRQSEDLNLKTEPESGPMGVEKTSNSHTETKSTDENSLVTDEIDFTKASTLEMPNTQSTEFLREDKSEDTLTEEPSRSAMNTEGEMSGRGDMESFTMTMSKEALETMSSILENKQFKEADIHEDWNDSESSNQNVESTTTETTSTISDKQIEQSEITTISTQSNESTTTERANEIKKLSKTSVQQSDDNMESKVNPENAKPVHLSTLINDENTEPESKDILVEIDQGSDPLLSSSTNEETILSGSNDDQDKVLNDEDNIVNKIKDFVELALQPAKIRKKHPIPHEFECRR